MMDNTEVAKKFLSRLTELKESAVKEKLIRLNISVEECFSPSRFPKITMVIKDEWEYWFYNDGTKNGLFIIAMMIDPSVSFLDNGVSCHIRFKNGYNGEVDLP